MIIDPTKTRQIAEYPFESPLMCCAFDAQGRFAIAGGRDRRLICLDVASGKTAMLEGHESWVGGTAAAGDDLILTADFAGRVVAWDCTGECPQARWTIVAHPGTIYALAASPDGARFATGDRDGVIRVWRTNDGQRTHEISGVDFPIYGLAFHPDGKRLASADRQPKSPRLKLWDFAAGTELRNIDVSQLSAYRRVEDIEWGGIRALRLSPDGNTLVACGSHQYSGPACALLFDVETGELKRKLASSLKGFYYSAKYHPQGFLMTAGGDIGKGEVRCWDPGKDESLADVPTPGPCTALDIHPDGKRFLATQMRGNRSYPDSGTLTLYEWTE